MDLSDINPHIIVPGIITLIIFLALSKIKLNENRTYSSLSEIRTEFQPAWWCVAGNYFCFTFVIAALLFPLTFPDPTVSDYIIFAPIAVIICLATLWGVYKMHNSVLIFKEKHIYFKYGKKIKVVPYDQIQFAYFANAHFYINIGEGIKAVVIPAMFNDNWLILEQIKRMARGNQNAFQAKNDIRPNENHK